VIPRALREALLLCALAAAPAAITGYRELKHRPDAPLASGEVKLSEAWTWGEKAVWIDARSRAKFEHRKIPGSLLLNAEEWDALVTKFLDEWDPEKTVVVYGDRGADNAQTVALRLREELKIPNVWVLQGGFEEWTRQ
jgi:rhodanese-related sulfurtransferase